MSPHRASGRRPCDRDGIDWPQLASFVVAPLLALAQVGFAFVRPWRLRWALLLGDLLALFLILQLVSWLGHSEEPYPLLSEIFMLIATLLLAGLVVVLVAIRDGVAWSDARSRAPGPTDSETRWALRGVVFSVVAALFGTLFPLLLGAALVVVAISWRREPPSRARFVATGILVAAWAIVGIALAAPWI